jgi:hypothetical protein
VAVTQNYLQAHDETLVRHVYDLYLIYTRKQNLNNIQTLFNNILKEDVLQFGMRHKEFKHDPLRELLYGMHLLKNDSKYQDRYNAFLGPLVYNSTPPTWEQGIESLQSLANILIE